MSNGIIELQSTLDKCKTLYDVLHSYCKGADNTDNIDGVIEFLSCIDATWSMAEQTGTSEYEIIEWIKDHKEDSVQCSILQTRCRCSWPVIKIECLDKVFFLDWVIEQL